MKRFSMILGTLCLGLTLSGQPGIVNTRPANPQDGKVLTMEETILSRDLTPVDLHCTWNGNSNILMHKDGKWHDYVLSSGECKEYIPQAAAPSLTAFTKGQSLWLRDKNGNEKSIAESENPDITYGQFVSRNEFGISDGIFWAPDSTKVAFYRKDESRVTSFPLLDITTRTGSLVEIKYPMAGMDSENVQLGIYDVTTGSTVYIKADEFGYDRYLTNICWAPDASKIYVQVLDRSQKHQKLNSYDPTSGEKISTILTEDNDKYVEPLEPLYFIKGSNDQFIYGTANRDGYRNLYLCDNEGNIRRLTATDADVAYIGNDGRYVYYTSAEVSPVENHLFRIEIKNLKKGVMKATFGQPQRLTTESGWHQISLSPDCRHFVDSWSNLTTPRVIDLCTADGKTVCNLLTAEDPTMGYAYTEINLGTVKSADGRYDNWYRLIKPKDFDPSKKYPVIVYVYGGPHSQMVQNNYMATLRRWEMYMAQRGYLVYVQDNRGTPNRGLEFEQAIHGQCGQAEMADQMEGVKMLMSLPYVDSSRIGVHGWSYGGFMTISLITNYPDIFKVGVAGGPVIDWKWYEVMYGERYMDHPDTNPEGYAKTSLINKAKDLKGKLLICQGAIDPVVVWEHSLSFIRECIKNNVQVDYFPYPCAEHNVMGKDRVHLHDKISMYFEDYL
ncbi:MAG: DPP IV N-terminal domain-containing protein [Bacteroidales bacterium]|nr:DPP IV N-terminal domain-containing protein [Bacteroidales bacterium]